MQSGYTSYRVIKSSFIHHITQNQYNQTKSSLTEQPTSHSTPGAQLFISNEQTYNNFYIYDSNILIIYTMQIKNNFLLMDSFSAEMTKSKYT